MPDQVVATDSQDVATTPQGTAAPGNDPASATTTGTGDVAAPKGFDEEFLKRLDELDPTTLPVNFRQKLEAPFKADHTKKTQELSEKEKRIQAERDTAFELARRALADRQAPAGPSAEDLKRKELLELATAGDGAAMQQLIQMEAARQIQPIQTQVALQNAAQAARAANPYVVQHWNEIVQTIQTDPVIRDLATANNYAAADRVMIALGLEHQVRDLVPKYETAVKEVEALKAKLAGYERERVTGLPSSTTRAGTTAGQLSSGDTLPADEVDAGRRAWKELGYPDSDFR